jgi:hypothetical protein
VPDIDIDKTVDCNDDGVFLDEDYGVAGDMGHWRIIVTNTGECDLFDVYVWDTNGMSWGPFDLAAGDFVQYDYDTVVNDDTENWAYVEAYDAAGFVHEDEDWAINYVCVPDIDIEKTVDCNDDGVFLDEDTGTAGDTGHWRIIVTNTGECDLFDVYVWDDNGMSWGPFDLPVGDSVQFDYDTIVNETTTNVAYVEAYDAAGGALYDEDDATNVVTPPASCRITGGGTIGSKRKPRVTHGFELHCNVDQLPNNLEVNWGGNHWHLLELTFAECFDDPAIEPRPPRAGCDTYHGIGMGRYNGVDGYQAEWIFTDAGEPGKRDWAWIKITAPDGSTVMEVSGFLQVGNQQFHNCTGKDLR